MFQFWLHSLLKPNSALFGLPTGRSSPSLCTLIRGHHSNLTAGTLFSNSRLVSYYQPLRFSTFWALKSWHLGLAQIKPAPDASLLVMIPIHVHDVLQLRHQKMLHLSQQTYSCYTILSRCYCYSGYCRCCG